MKKVLMMAGGTGGHVIPALAVAKSLQQRQVLLHWLGCPQGIETTLVPEAGIDISYITIAALRGKSKLTLLAAPWRLLRALLQAIKVLRRFKPDVVVGMGGFATGPGGLAAKLLGIPLVIHEQNAVAGMTNRILASFAKRIFCAFPNTFSQGRDKVCVVGNPLRADIIQAKPQREVHEGPLKLLVIGGSLGALSFNQLIPKALAQLTDDERPIVRHQTGNKHLSNARDYYQQQQVKAKLLPFISDMVAAYTWADVIICRAGALTVSEVAAMGLASILIPYPYAVDDHQTKNANILVAEGAAILVQQADLDETRLVELLRYCHQNRQSLVNMGQAAQRVAQIDATEKVTDYCMEIMGENRNTRNAPN